VHKKVAEEIESYLHGFLQGLVNKYDPSVVKNEIFKKGFLSEEKGKYKPFHAALIPAELLRIQSFFRSFSTSLGQGVFEYIAKIVSRANPKWVEVKSNSKFDATASPDVQSIVDNFLEALEKKEKKPLFIPGFPSLSSSNIKKITVDLYLKSKRGRKFFFEIKSPKPNKDQTRRTKEKFLYLLATYPDSKTFFALPYNPFGEDKQKYKWSFTEMFFEKKELLIGKEFWDFIGGKNTYEEILRVFQKVGKERGKDIIKHLIKGEG